MGGKSFTIESGSCTSRRVHFGLLGNVTGGRGFSFLLEHPNRTGRNDIIQASVQVNGLSVGGPVGTAIVAKGLKGAAFSLVAGAGGTEVTGSWTCGQSGVSARAP